MHPTAQRSTFSVYVQEPKRSSGARYQSVTTPSVIQLPGSVKVLKTRRRKEEEFSKKRKEIGPQKPGRRGEKYSGRERDRQSPVEPDREQKGERKKKTGRIALCTDARRRS